MKRPPYSSYLAAVLLLLCVPGRAATIYKSVDENGVVTFSDTKPEQAVLVETLVIDVQDPTDGETAAQRLQDMRETTDRMAADRMAREQHRAAMRELNAQSAAPQPPQDLTDYYTSPVVYSGYPYPVRRPWQRPQRPYPEHPIARPPLLPPAAYRPRPPPSSDYPASLIRRHYDPKVRASLDR